MSFLASLFGGGKKSSSAAPVVSAPSVANDSSADKKRKIGRASIIKTNQQSVLAAPTTGRSILTAT